MIVEEFYVGMNPGDYKRGTTVMVRGREVRADAGDINRHFRTPLPDEPTVTPDYPLTHANLQLELAF
ncbi:hypothetical protein Q3G72_025882 [Acer saccharum]|nr:hypothetical protein Q3G72_025882 [Acer saccharum]